MAITGAHVLLYSSAAEELRAVLRDVFNWKFVDAGGGWLIFALPPSELGVHPAEGPAFEAGTPSVHTDVRRHHRDRARAARERGRRPGRAGGRGLGHQRRARSSRRRGGAALRAPPCRRCRNSSQRQRVRVSRWCAINSDPCAPSPCPWLLPSWRRWPRQRKWRPRLPSTRPRRAAAAASGSNTCGKAASLRRSRTFRTSRP